MSAKITVEITDRLYEKLLTISAAHLLSDREYATILLEDAIAKDNIFPAKSVARYMVCKKHNEQDCERCSVLEL